MPHIAAFLSVCLLATGIATGAWAGRGGVGLGWLSGTVAVAKSPHESALPIAPAAAAAAIAGPSAAIPLTALRPQILGASRIAAGLRDLIAQAEAGAKGYDAIHYSAKRLPSKPPSQLTLSEIRQWIRATPGQQHAIGRYQIIPSTLDMLIDRLGLPENARFSPQLQDQMADSLMGDAGFEQMISGDLHPGQFMDGLAKIWAGLPNSAGKSHYDGFAGNRATIGRRSFESKVASILKQ